MLTPYFPGALLFSTLVWGFFIMNYEKAEEGLLTVGMLCYCRHQNNFAKCGRILVIL